jgi:hypothetical protein
MATIHKSAKIEGAAAVAWARISAVGELQRILPMVTRCRLEGDIRYCTMADGSESEEHIVSIEPALMRIAYAITRSRLPIERHFSSMQVVAEGAGARLDWITDIKPDALQAMLAPALELMLAQMVERLGAA